jgi:predicted GIY-YIG superfamily endonuclease
MASYVYLLINTPLRKISYVGATVNLDRRLRQHNKEIKGGAVATTTKVTDENKWLRVCYISGFPDWQTTLQFEWRWKQLTRKIPFNKPPLYRRLDALKILLNLDKPTSKSIPFIQWQTKPQIHFEDEDAKNYFYSINI